MWVDLDLPKGWKGRNTVPRLDIIESDPLALGKFVDRAVVESEMMINQQRQKMVANAQIVSSVSSPAKLEAPRSEEAFKLSSNDPNRSSRYGSTVVVPTQPQRQTVIVPESRPSSFRLPPKRRPRKR